MVRRILTTIIMATASVFSMVSCATEPVQKEIGLQLYSIRDQINEDLDTSLDAVAQAVTRLWKWPVTMHRKELSTACPVKPLKNSVMQKDWT